MKCTIPEISWHNRDPVLSVDIQVMSKKNCYRLVTGGADSHVCMWYLKEDDSGIVTVEFASDLSRHQKAVNVVRFSPDGELLASGDDESVIIVWKQKTDQDTTEFPSNTLDEDTTVNKETWIVTKILRGHLEDVYDISWSPTSTHLISGSVDNTAIMWDIQKGKNIGMLSEHKKFVQGVAWDPKNQYVSTLSSDRSLRTYNIQTKKVISRACKSKLPVDSTHELHDKVVPLFHDDTMKSFFRRLCFSPDGQLLIAPSGLLETSETGKKPTSVTHIFTRGCLNKPAVCLPSLQHYSVAVKCCPVLFDLMPSEEKPLIKLPYRIVIAVATENNILLYDTQHSIPFAFIANIHYTKLTDISWSKDGKLLIASSTDGYCSIISFGDTELGTVYISNETEPIIIEQDVLNTPKTPKNRKLNNKEIKNKINENLNTTNESIKTEQQNKNDKLKTDQDKNNEEERSEPMDIDRTEEIINTKNNTPDKINTLQINTPKQDKNSTSNSILTPNKTPRRIQLITLSSPTRKIKIDEDKIKERINETTDADDNKTNEIEKKFKESDRTTEIEKKIKESDKTTEIEKKIKESVKTTEIEKKIKESVMKESITTETIDFDNVLENTGDSLLNPSFIEDTMESPRHKNLITDFKNLNETISKDQHTFTPPKGKIGCEIRVSPRKVKASSEPKVTTPTKGKVSSEPKVTTPKSRASTEPKVTTPTKGGVSSELRASPRKVRASTEPKVTTPKSGTSTELRASPRKGKASTEPKVTTPTKGGASSAPKVTNVTTPTKGGSISELRCSPRKGKSSIVTTPKSEAEASSEPKVTPPKNSGSVDSPCKRTPGGRRVQLITLSSPKVKKTNRDI